VRQILRMLAALAILGLVQPVLAQEETPPPGLKLGPRAGAQPPMPKAEVISTHGKWELQCTELKAQDGTPVRNCGLFQSTKNDKDENIQLAVIVSKIKREQGSATQMRVIAPIGVYLPTGIPVEIDGAALPNRLVFTRCIGRICEALGETSEETLKKFMRGNESIFYIYDRPGNGFPMKISLEGFAAAMKALESL
jgi:invasion protein IalB